jgi:hypothetical protein
MPAPILDREFSVLLGCSGQLLIGFHSPATYDSIVSCSFSPHYQTIRLYGDPVHSHLALLLMNVAWKVCQQWYFPNSLASVPVQISALLRG